MQRDRKEDQQIRSNVLRLQYKKMLFDAKQARRGIRTGREGKSRGRQREQLHRRARTSLLFKSVFILNLVTIFNTNNKTFVSLKAFNPHSFRAKDNRQKATNKLKF